MYPARDHTRGPWQFAAPLSHFARARGDAPGAPRSEQPPALPPRAAMTTSALVIAPRWLLAATLVAVAVPRSPAARELVFVALGERTPLGMH